VTFTAGEVRNPKRNLPLSLGIGVGTVSILYIACNFIYLSVLTLQQIQTAPEDRVATAVVSVMFGPIATRLMAIAIMVSTFGCCNGMIMSGARVYFTMAQDNLFFRRAGTLDPVHHTPVFALAIQCVWTILLTLSGQYNDLLDYVIFAVLLFYILTIGGLFRLRRTRPDLDRPYRAAGYPVLPALYMLVAGVIEILLLINKPTFTVRGLILVLLGVPVYFLWRRKTVNT
jgi:APA family basic amino acid/polyamine antiporter